MANLLPIVKHPDPLLRQISRSVESQQLNHPDFLALCDNMIATMYGDDGVGLAAPQVGQSLRLIVVGKLALKDIYEKNLPFSIDADLVLINPVLSEYSWKKLVDSEGCLSVPGLAGDVERHFSLKAEALNRAGQPISFTATDYFARVLQHELDHLNGVLFIDRATNIVKAEKKRRYS